MSDHLTSLEEYRSLVAGATSEVDLLIDVELRLTMGGWKYHHIGRSDKAQQHGDPGFPDIVAVRGNVLLVRELKAQQGRVETAQREWLDALSRVEIVDASVWRPSDRDAIEKALA